MRHQIFIVRDVVLAHNCVKKLYESTSIIDFLPQWPNDGEDNFAQLPDVQVWTTIMTQKKI